MTTTFALRPETTTRLDYGLLRRVFLTVGLTIVLISPLAPDAFELAVGALVPWVVLQIIGTPTMPVAMVFFLLWQWLQTFARALQGLTDGLPMARSIYGAWVEDAYWYMLASVVMLAMAARLVLGKIPPPTERERVGHLNWRPIDLFFLYLASFVLTFAASYALGVIPALYQQLDALAKLKTAVTFVLFAVVLGHNRGYYYLLAALGIELVTGFTGLLSEFKGVFIVLAMSALAVRLRWTPIVGLAATVWLVVLLLLALFWTAVKTEYREVATKSTVAAELEGGSQAVRASFDERAGYILGRLFSPGEIDWELASYALVRRLAYVDIFGSVIGVRESVKDDSDMRQWSDALSHVFQPRILFPNKPGLSDSEVFLRLTKADPTEVIRMSTSISVGYMGENYVDMEFPLMLAGIFALGLMVCGIARYFMMMRLPWMVREALVMAFIYTVGGTGVEVSLPKLLGGAIMFGVVYALLIKFGFPIGLRWLDARAQQARDLEVRMRRAAKSSYRAPKP